MNISLSHSRTFKWHSWVGHVLVFHCNYVCISYRFCDIQRQSSDDIILKSGLWVVQGKWKWYHSKAWIRILIAFHSSVLSCIIYEIKRDSVRKSRFLYNRAWNAPVRASPSEYHKVWQNSYINKCVGDDTKAAARRRPTCSRKTKKYGEEWFSIWRPFAILNFRGLIIAYFKRPCRNVEMHRTEY